MLIVGHRGARFEAPENTVPGFRYAVELGLASVELDVRMSSDGHLVVMHDETVDRTTDGAGRVADLELATLQGLDARSIFPSWPEACTVPTLEEALEALRPVPEIITEIKSDEPQRLRDITSMTIKAVQAADLTDQVTITSFDPIVLEVVQAEAPHIRRGYIGRWDEEHFLERSIELGCQQADVHHPTADHGLVAKARDHGMRVICWPTNSQEELDNALSFDPQLFCTDNPTLLRDLYERTRN